MTKISIITPTKDREAFLPQIWKCVQNQTIPDFEWLIHDGSCDPSPFLTALKEKDDRVRYMHEPKDMSIGAKRNALCHEATGKTIVHFDDDDYYAPGYVEGMLSLLARENADFVKLFGFYLYHQRSGLFGYWDMEVAFPLHYIMDPRKDDLHVGPKHRNHQDEWGYGFSYVYARKVWMAHPFEDERFGEDQPFATAAVANFKHAGMQDRDFLMVHVMHGTNASIAYPQQILTHDVGQACFPGFAPISASSAAGP